MFSIKFNKLIAFLNIYVKTLNTSNSIVYKPKWILRIICLLNEVDYWIKFNIIFNKYIEFDKYHIYYTIYKIGYLITLNIVFTKYDL